MNNKKIAVLWLSLAIILSTITIIVKIAPIVTGITIYVDDDYGSEDATHKKTIVSAIENASNGDTIYVYNGEYMGDEMGWLAIYKSVNIIGQSNENTIINNTYVIFVSDNINFSKFRFQGCLVETHFNNININYCNFTSFSNLDIYSSYVWVSNSSILERGSLWIHSTSHVYIDNVYMNNTQYPLWIDRSSNIFITNSILSYLDDYGIYFDESINIVMRNTDIYSDERGGIEFLWNSYSDPKYFNHSIDTSNTINGKPIYYFFNKTNLNLNSLDAGHITFALCSDSKLNNSKVIGGDGITVAFSSNINFTNNNISSSLKYGIYIHTSSHNSFTNNQILKSRYGGIILHNSEYNVFNNNTMKSNGWSGLFMQFNSGSNTVTDCIFIDNGWGLESSSDDNSITNCIFSNLGWGMMIGGEWNIISDNIIENNNDGIWLYGSDTRNNFFINNSLNNSAKEFYLEQGPNAFVINTSFNKSKVVFKEIDNSYLVVQWFLHVNITDYLGNPIPNAYVRVMENDNGSFDHTYRTETDGFKRWIVVSEFWQNKTNKIYYTPHNIISWNDTLVGYAQPLIHESKTVNIVLYNGTLLDLKPGWNLVSLPRIPSDTNLQTILQPIKGQYNAIQWYNIEDGNDPWKHHHISKPSNLNDLDEINHTRGFWIHITDPGGTTLMIPEEVLTSNQTITLYPGWNQVGYPSLINRIRPEALNNLDFGTDVDAIWTHNATTQKWEEIGSSDYFELGRGYWIYSTVTKTWDVPL